MDEGGSAVYVLSMPATAGDDTTEEPLFSGPFGFANWRALTYVPDAPISADETNKLTLTVVIQPTGVGPTADVGSVEITADTSEPIDLMDALSSALLAQGISSQDKFSLRSEPVGTCSDPGGTVNIEIFETSES